MKNFLKISWFVAQVAEYLDCRPIIGVKATKKKFLSELRCSNLMHIATYADMEKGGFHSEQMHTCANSDSFLSYTYCIS